MLNPILKNLTLPDLIQRYQRSWIRYDEQMEYVTGFLEADGKIHIIFAGRTELFDWKKVDITRPNSGWYSVTGVAGAGANPQQVLCYFQLKNDRQFSRGLNLATTFWFIPENSNWKSFIRVQDVYEQAYNQKSTKIQSSMASVDAIRNKGSAGAPPHIVFQPNLACLVEPKDKSINFYYRTKCIGVWPKADKLKLYHSVFEDELRESIFDLDFTKADFKTSMEYREKKLKPPKRFLVNSYFIPPVMEGGIGGEIRAGPIPIEEVQEARDDPLDPFFFEPPARNPDAGRARRLNEIAIEIMQTHAREGAVITANEALTRAHDLLVRRGVVRARQE